MAKQIEITDTITVGSLADKLDIPVSKLIGELMKNGVFATINEQIDSDTAEIIIGELGVDVTLQKKQAIVEPVVRRKSSSKVGSHRPPVVAIMGHVDHGKTSLLDAIRGSSKANVEAGGITQHISACQVKHKGQTITFLDTPGHEAFAAIRDHAARLTDLAILVVAADDGVKPQTEEAIRFVNNVGVKILVAINKIDKPDANINRVKQDLANHNLLVGEFGGNVIAEEVSAKNKEGISELLDTVLLLAEDDDLRAPVDKPAQGLVIESHLEKGRGPVAHVLVEEGTLRVGDFIVAGGSYAKVRSLQTTDDHVVEKALPSTPVVITGFKSIPDFGDEFRAYGEEKEAKLKAKLAAETKRGAHTRQNLGSSELIDIIDRRNKLNKLNVLLKADVQGSLTSVRDSLKTIGTEEVAIRVVGESVGPVTANDLALAKSSNAIVYGFGVGITTNNRRLAARDGVSVRLFKVIYELIDDVRSELSGLLDDEIVEEEIGSLEVKGVFKTTKSEVIIGGEVKSGPLRTPAIARIFREKKLVGEAQLKHLQRGSNEAKDLLEGEMGGLSLKTTGRLGVEIGDHIKFFDRKVIERNL